MGASEKAPPRGSSIPRLHGSGFSEQEARVQPVTRIDRSCCIETNQDKEIVPTSTIVLTRLGATAAEDSGRPQR